jgi:hypothetical protein
VAAIAVLLLNGGGNSRRGFGDVSDGLPDELRPEILAFAGVGEPSRGEPAALRLVAFTCARIEAFNATSCEGSVQNVSQAPLSDVAVVVEWLTGDGDVVAVNRGAVQFNPVLPGQQAPWALQASHNPEFKSYRLSFEGADGPVVVEDRSSVFP